MTQTSIKKDYLSLHLLRIIGAIAVIAIHSSAPVLYMLDTAPWLDWLTTNLLNSFGRWAVPIFIMISGALLLDNTQENWRTFYKKRFTKLAIPCLFWYWLYFILMYLSPKYALTIPNVTKTLFIETPHIHLYFIFIIIGLYLITPLLRKMLQQLQTPQQLFVITLLSLYTLTWTDKPFVGFLWLPYVSYYCLGFFIKNHLDKLKVYLPLVIYLVTSILIGYSTWYRFDHDSTKPVYFYSYTNLLVFLQACSVFIASFNSEPFFQNISAQAKRIIVYVSSLSFGVFLASPLVQDGVWYLFSFIAPTFALTAVGILTHILVTVCITVLGISIIKKLPILKVVV